jgi:hypothetical protein
MEVLVEHFVTLPPRSANLAVPPEYSSKLRFEADTHRLVYSGFMSKADFDRLSRLSDDWGYRRALEDLFRLCMIEEQKPPLLRRLVASLGF